MRFDAIHVIFAALALAFRTPKHKALSGRLSHSDARVLASALISANCARQLFPVAWTTTPLEPRWAFRTHWRQYVSLRENDLLQKQHAYIRCFTATAIRATAMMQPFLGHLLLLPLPVHQRPFPVCPTVHAVAVDFPFPPQQVFVADIRTSMLDPEAKGVVCVIGYGGHADPRALAMAVRASRQMVRCRPEYSQRQSSKQPLACCICSNAASRLGVAEIRSA